MSPMRFDAARKLIRETVAESFGPPQVERVGLDSSAGRILAMDVEADRDYPPFNRSARDGFAVIAADVAEVPATLDLLGETQAGEPSRFALSRGQTVEIMTGAPGPANADAVVMVEYSTRNGSRVTLHRTIESGRNLIPAGSEVQAEVAVLCRGTRIGHPQIAQLGTVGYAEVPVFRQPEVAILSTGDEVLPVEAQPESFQIRNSNAHALAAQIRRRGGRPRMLPIAPDRMAETRALIEDGLRSDMLLLSGGVSMGKHDLVEDVLADLGARILITSVRIQPGKPMVFAMVGSTPVLGLPGNPLSTMVTFELFGALLVDLLGGARATHLRFARLPLAQAFRHKPVLTRFIGARMEGDYGDVRVRPDRGEGSGDVTAFARADCLMVASQDRASWEAGDLIEVMPL